MTKDEIQKNSEHWYNKYKDAEKRITDLENKIADIKANFDYILEGKDLEIKTLGERCNQLLKDKGELTDKVSNQAESLRITMLEEEKKNKRIEELEKENAELKDKLSKIERKCKFNFVDLLHDVENESKQEEQLTKSTELLKEAQGYIENIDDILYDEIEQFLKEIEK